MNRTTGSRGKNFVFTGELSSFTKEEAAQFVVNNGGSASDNVTPEKKGK
ncbi:MAG: hypothetical protein IPJ54_11185 [Saprospiraceae bacterium]|nr:hypothetical protein [Saprospiraceae bacterium]